MARERMYERTAERRQKNKRGECIRFEIGEFLYF